MSDVLVADRLATKAEVITKREELRRLANTAGFDNSGLFEHTQVLRNGRLAQVQMIHQLPDRPLAVS